MIRNIRFSILPGLSSFICLLFLSFFILSCQKSVRVVNPPVNPPPDSVTYNHGVFVINEGNFNSGNASVTFLSESNSNLIVQDLFNQVNKRNLGDVAEEMKIFNGLGFIVVNNSNTVEVVSLTTFKSVASIKNGLNSPRNIEIIDSTKAYVTNLLKDISVVSLKTFSVTGSIKNPYWTEGMIRYKNLVFVSCIGGYTEPNSKRSAKILIIDTRSDKIVDSIQSGKEPLGIVIDRKNKVWVLCTGGYDNFEAPSLLMMDPELMVVEKTFHFPATTLIPSRLCINGTGDTLYFLYNGVYQMPVSSPALPDQPLIPSGSHVFYGLDVHPVNGNVFVSDAIDFVQNGVVYRYNQANGLELKHYPTGRIPGSFSFTDLPPGSR